MPNVRLPDWAQVTSAKQPDQVAYVVPDLDAAIPLWSALLGRDDWRIYTYGPHNTHDLNYRGTPTEYSMRLALCGASPQVELIQSLRGPNLYQEWIDRAGAGLHHVGFFVDSIADVRSRLDRLGVPPVQTGSGYGLDGDGGYAYYELPGLDGLVEYIEIPKRRMPAEPFATAPAGA